MVGYNFKLKRTATQYAAKRRKEGYTANVHGPVKGEYKYFVYVYRK